ncbi:MAG: RNA methyltransferase [Candidatus Riflebacteria bacterium]|nr:RNA methyltransferase [Candidatus Riflebacteria bacterium]
MPSNPILIVLVKPLYPGNVGAVARAMANCGLTELTVVGCRWDGWPREAYQLASGADPILRSARRVDTLAEALQDSVLAAATTSRDRADGVPLVTHREAAPRLLAARASGRVAVVFGPEDRGLSGDEMALCSVRIRIPTSTMHSSLNLAQAVLLVAHEMFVIGSSTDVAPGSSAASPLPADLGEQNSLFDELQALLDSVGFLNPQNPDHIMKSIRQVFLRGRLDDREVRIFRGMVRQLRWALGRVRGGGVGAPD